MPDASRPETSSQEKQLRRNSLPEAKGNSPIGMVKTANTSTWELFVSSTSFSSLDKKEGHIPRTREELREFDNVEEAHQHLTPYMLRLQHIMVLSYKRRFKEACDLAESSQRNLEFSTVEIARLQVEAIWQRYLCKSKEEAEQSIRRLNEVLARLQSPFQGTSIETLKACIYLYKGRILYAQQYRAQAVRLFKEALTFCQRDTLTYAQLLDSIALYYEHSGNFSHATHLMQEALETKKKTPFVHETGITYQMLGQVHLLIEQFKDAQRNIERALAIATQIEDDRREAELMNDLIKIAIINGQLDKALHITQECLIRCESRKLWNHHGSAMLYRAYIHFLNNEHTEAYGLLQSKVIPLFESYSDEKGYGVAYRLLGALLNSMGKRREALEALSESIIIFKKQRRGDELAKTYYEQARLYISMRQQDLAAQSLFHALGVAQQNNLMFLVRPIEDELFTLAPEQWEKITEHRLRHEAFIPGQQGFNQSVASLTTVEGASHSPSVNNSQNALMSLLRLGQAIAAERELDNILQLVREETVNALAAERCTVFVYDKETRELWSQVASGIEGTKTLRIPSDKGLAGHVLKMGETLNIPDVYNDPRFNRDVDRKTGYRTRNLLCIPILNRDNESIGVVQVLNKRDGAFTKADEDLLRAIGATTGITLENAMMANEQKKSFESFILTLSSTIDARDPITAGHSERVADYSLLLGDEMQMQSNDLEALRFSALLHDIGKIGIKEDVLTKEGRLTIDEYKHIQEHARYTFEILQNIHFASHLKDVPEIAASHHERVDGKGYYKGLKGDAIPLSGRIIALSDVFDAITSLRHYRSRMPFDKVLSIIRKDAGSHFDSECVDMFFRVPLYRLAEVLVKERRVKHFAEVAPMVNNLDRTISLAEFDKILSKENRTLQEERINEDFSSIYYVLPPKRLDNF